MPKESRAAKDKKAQVLQAQGADRLTIEQNLARFELIETQQQLDDGQMAIATCLLDRLVLYYRDGIGFHGRHCRL